MSDPLILKHSFLDWVSLGVLFFSTTVLILAFWKLHEVPHRVAESRGHPHSDAIQAACLISLFTGGFLWPFTLIWAYLGTPKVVTVLEQSHDERAVAATTGEDGEAQAAGALAEDVEVAARKDAAS